MHGCHESQAGHGWVVLKRGEDHESTHDNETICHKLEVIKMAQGLRIPFPKVGYQCSIAFNL